jgi:hypothetical protein
MATSLSMLKLEAIQYRSLRIALGLMQFTYVQTVDGSRSDKMTEFGVFHFADFEMDFRLHEPSGVFTSVTTAIFYALEHILSHSTGRYLILSDSMGSVTASQTTKASSKIHLLVFSSKKAFWQLAIDGYLHYKHNLDPITCWNQWQ